jgi:hypothetical protein
MFIYASWRLDHTANYTKNVIISLKKVYKKKGQARRRKERRLKMHVGVRAQVITVERRLRRHGE